ncbi:MAG: B12-binding domain-containing radical SAM protein [Oscillospiraceae bacterium]|nr:B12-binding domain-containing radical SAM protein [Oscillospiraceae bacterium]
MQPRKNVLLVTVSSREMQRIRKTRYINFQQCTMPYLASFFPDDWTIAHIDEVCEAVDYNKQYDLVALTFHTPSAPHAYEIADSFRARGSTVIMGGPHVTLLPDEARAHADAVFVGEAELTLPQFISDWAAGRAKDRYDASEIPDLCGIPFSKKEHFHRKDHSGGILFASRGCPNACEFCTLAVMYNRRYRCRPVEEVAAEFASFHGKIIIFWDDNLTADMDYAKSLCKAIAPHKKWWSSQVSVTAGADDEFLSLAARSGCKQLFIGFESVSQKSLDSARKGFNRTDDYADIVERIHSHGIAVQAGFVFGFDEDAPDVFDKTIDFLEGAGIQNATFHILTPYPGTPLYERLKREGRILTYDWAKYNARTDVVFEPKNMSASELLRGFNDVNRRFYSAGSIYRRLKKSPVGLYWTLPLNLIYRRLWYSKGI